ncbi:MAG: ABC transporter substrate-binding protein [Desulfomonilaceae bacterium]
MKTKLCSIAIATTLALSVSVSIAGECEPSCVIDSIGEKVCVRRIPQRVVSLAPSLTELMFDLNAGSRLVGRTSRCNFPEEARSVLEVGLYMAPDFEKLLTAKPDLVLATKNGMRLELIDRIKGFGIPVYVDDSSSIDEIKNLISKVGFLIGQNQDARALITDIQTRRDSLRQVLANLERRSVLFVVGINPLIVASSGSFLSSLISEAGGKNVVNDLGIPFPKLSIEEVIKQDPDVIFMLDKECHGIECIGYWKNYAFLKAFRSNRIYEVDSDLVSRPGARTIRALEILSNHLHSIKVIPALPATNNTVFKGN